MNEEERLARIDENQMGLNLHVAIKRGLEKESGFKTVTWKANEMIIREFETRIQQLQGKQKGKWLTTQYKTFILFINGGKQMTLSPNRTPEDELIEKLAAIEHERWADWQKWMHSMLKVNDSGEYTLPTEAIRGWDRQIETPYSELSEKEKESDREQVRRYWSLVGKFILADRKAQAAALLEKGPKDVNEIEAKQMLAGQIASAQEYWEKGFNKANVQWRSIIKENLG